MVTHSDSDGATSIDEYGLPTKHVEAFSAAAGLLDVEVLVVVFESVVLGASMRAKPKRLLLIRACCGELAWEPDDVVGAGCPPLPALDPEGLEVAGN
jgi:hypothetical protein